MAAGVTPEQIYETLLANGYSSVQAFGIMGNMINESSLNPEAVNPGGPKDGVGLVQWETTYYPAAAGLVTGNPVLDMDNQIKYLVQTAGPHSQATSGSTGAQVAGNFAEYFERCAGCNPGGPQYNSRVANAATVEGWARSGHWPGAGAGAGLVRSSRQVAPVVSWGENSLHAFAVAANGSVEYRAWNGSSWNPWVNLGGAVSSTYQTVAPVAWEVNHLDFFFVGTNDHIMHKGWGGSSWNANFDDLGDSGEAPASAPLAVSQETDSLDVFYMGPYHHTIWRRSWRGGWGGWTDLGAINSAAGAIPAVSTWGAGRLDACVVGDGKTVMHSGWDGGTWSGGWENLGGNPEPTLAPSLVSWGPNRLDLFVTGTDSNLWHNSWNGKWLGWQDMGNPGEKFVSAPAAVCQGQNLIDVFVMGPHYQTIWRQSWNGNSWSGWEDLGAIVSASGATPAVAAWGQGRLDAFTKVAPDSVSHSGWNGGKWSGGWENLGGGVKFF